MIMGYMNLPSWFVRAKEKNMKPLVIFGTGQIAEIAHFYFSHDSLRQVVAFCVDENYLKEHEFCSLPVIAFETIEKEYPPSQNDLFVAISYAELNDVRKRKYLQAKMKGYQLANYVSSKATIWPGIQMGDNCFILEDNTIQPFVQLGNNIILWSGNHIGHHSVIHDHCFISSHVVVSGGVVIKDQCFLGVNATLRDHIVIKKNCIIAAGSLVLKDTEENGVYAGSPAKLMKMSNEVVQI